MRMTSSILVGLLAALIVMTMSGPSAAARDADPASLSLATAAQTAKQQCLKTCRARYHDCRRLKQLPSFECQGVYQDCTRYTCTGLGPG